MPIRTGAGPPVSIRDVASVSDSTDIPTAYALVNGRRAVYIPVTKRPDALDAQRGGRGESQASRRFQSLVPDDIAVSYELDQSTNVSAALDVGAARGHPRRAPHRPHGAAVPARLAQLGDRRHHHSVRAARGGRRAVGRRPDHQHHDARRPGAGRRHPRRRSHRRHREHPHPSGTRCGAVRAPRSTPACEVVVPAAARHAVASWPSSCRRSS